MTWLDWVQFAGVFLEVVAIVFAVREVGERARNIRAFMVREYEPSGRADRLGTAIYLPKASKELSLQQRVARLERQVLEARMEASAYTEKAVEVVRNELERMVRQQDHDTDSLTTLVKDVLMVSWRTVLPVVLLLLGLIAQNLPTIAKTCRFIAGVTGG